MSEQLQQAQDVMRELRGYRQQYQSISTEYTKVKRESDTAKSQVLIDKY